MADDVHITPERSAQRIARSGIAARSRGRAGEHGVYCMAALSSFTLTHQWVRELRRWHPGVLFAVQIRIGDAASNPAVPTSEGWPQIWLSIYYANRQAAHHNPTVSAMHDDIISRMPIIEQAANWSDSASSSHDGTAGTGTTVITERRELR